MKLRIRKERLLSLLILLPYVEAFFSFFEVYKVDSVFRSINIMTLLLALIFLLSPGRKIRLIFSYYKLELLLPIFLIFTLFWTERYLVSWSTLTWMITPIIFAISFSSYIIDKGFDINLFLKYCLTNFIFYTVVAIFHGIIVHHTFIDPSIRFNPPGGGSVIFGYSVVLYLSLMFYLKEHINLFCFSLYTLIMLIAVIGTQSRAAMWPALLLLMIHILFSRKQNRFMLVLSIILFGVGLLSLLILPVVLQEIAPRLLQREEYARSLSFSGVKLIFSEAPLFNKLFGFGLGNVFEYQKWLIAVQEGTKLTGDIFINYRGGIILIQPHNTYFYYLLETGVVSLLLFLLPFLKYLWKAIRRYQFWYFVFIISILFINAFDSVLIVEPGVAGVIYTYCFLIYFHIDYIRSKNEQ